MTLHCKAKASHDSIMTVFFGYRPSKRVFYSLLCTYLTLFYFIINARASLRNMIGMLMMMSLCSRFTAELSVCG